MLVTALVVSEASSRTIQLIFCPPIVVGSSSMVFFSGMPSEAAGPVADSVTPTLMSAQAPARDASAASAGSSCGLHESSVLKRAVSGATGEFGGLSTPASRWHRIVAIRARSRRILAQPSPVNDRRIRSPATHRRPLFFQRVADFPQQHDVLGRRGGGAGGGVELRASAG